MNLIGLVLFICMHLCMNDDDEDITLEPAVSLIVSHSPAPLPQSLDEVV